MVVKSPVMPQRSARPRENVKVKVKVKPVRSCQGGQQGRPIVTFRRGSRAKPNGEGLLPREKGYSELVTRRDFTAQHGQRRARTVGQQEQLDWISQQSAVTSGHEQSVSKNN